MFDSPSDPAEFDRLVPDEDAAEQLVASIRWPDGACCPRCGSRAMTRLSTRRLWQCRACRHQTSVRSSTGLHRTRVPLRDILEAVWRTARPGGASTRSVAIALGYRYETIFDLLHKMRAAMAERAAWLLESSPVHVGTAEIPITKRAKGDPERRAPVVVGLAVEEEQPPPFVPGLRFTMAPGTEAPADADLLGQARDHVSPAARAVLEPVRVIAHPLRRRVSRALEQEVRCVRLLLTRVHGGVSRRYLANYLAQYAYRSNRWHRRGQWFGWVLRRLTWEPWRPRSDMALAVP